MYWIIAKWALLIIGIVGIVWWGVSTVYTKVYNDGMTAERTEWQKREVRESAERAEKVAQLVTQREKERVAADARIQLIAKTYAKEIENATTQKERHLAAARNGAIRLYRNRQDTIGRGDDRGTEKDVTGASSGCDGLSGSGLHPETTAKLYALAHDANRNTKQLGACQKVVDEYLTIINGNTTPVEANAE